LLCHAVSYDALLLCLDRDTILPTTGRRLVNAMMNGSFDAAVDGGKLLDDVLLGLFAQSPQAGFDCARDVLQLLRVNMTLQQVNDSLTKAVGRDGQPTDIGQAVAAALLPLASGGSTGSTPPPSGLLALAATNGRPASKLSEKDDHPPVGSAMFAEVAAEAVDLLLKGKTAAAALTLVAARRQECAWFEDAIGRFSAAKPTDEDACHEACDVCTTPSPEWRCAECPRNRLFCSACWEHVHMAPQALAGKGTGSKARADLSRHGRTDYGGEPANKNQTWDLYQAVVGGNGETLEDGDARARLAAQGVTYDGSLTDGLSVAMGALAAEAGGAKKLCKTIEGQFRAVCLRAKQREMKLPPGVVATATFESARTSAGPQAGGFRFGSALVPAKEIATLFAELRVIADECDEWKHEPLRIVFAACYGTRVSMHLERCHIQFATCDGPHPSSTLLQSVELLTSCSWDLPRFVSEYNEHVLAPWKAAQGSWQTGAECQAIKGYVLADVTDR
jgi:hypothetical protein